MEEHAAVGLAGLLWAELVDLDAPLLRVQWCLALVKVVLVLFHVLYNVINVFQ